MSAHAQSALSAASLTKEDIIARISAYRKAQATTASKYLTGISQNQYEYLLKRIETERRNTDNVVRHLSSNDITTLGDVTLTGSTLSGGTATLDTLSVSGATSLSSLTVTDSTATTTLAGGLSVAGSTGLTVLQNGTVIVGSSSIPLFGAREQKFYLEKNYTSSVTGNYMTRNATQFETYNNHTNPSNYLGWRLNGLYSAIYNPTGQYIPEYTGANKEYNLFGGISAVYGASINNGVAATAIGVSGSADNSGTITQHLRGGFFTASNRTTSTVPFSAGVTGLSWNNTSGGITDSYGVYARALNYDVGSTTRTYGVFGESASQWTSGQVGTGYGVYGSVYVTAGTHGNGYGVYGKILRTGGTFGGSTYAGGYVEANAVTSGTNYGLLIGSVGGGSVNNYTLYSSSTAHSYLAGNVGIGTTSPFKKLSVVGDVYASSFIDDGITLTAPDYVFDDPAYKQLTLPEIETYTEEHDHLPWLTPRGSGAMSLSDRINEVLEALENLFLRVFELADWNREQDARIEEQNARIRELEVQLQALHEERTGNEATAEPETTPEPVTMPGSEGGEGPEQGTDETVDVTTVPQFENGTDPEVGSEVVDVNESTETVGEQATTPVLPDDVVGQL